MSYSLIGQLTLLFLLPAMFNLSAQDWPQWRGPNRDGVVSGFTAPASWPEDLKRVWQVDVGTGHASPVVASGKIYQFSRLDDDEVITCLDPNSGRTLWRKSYPAPYRMNPAARAHGKGPKSTPVVSDGKIFTFGISGILSCYDAATGKPYWQKEFSGDFSSTSPLYGVAMSAMVDHGLLIAHVGGDGDGALTAFEVETGEVRWSWTGDGPAYASPIIAELGGMGQIVTQTEEHIVGIDVTTGKPLWTIPFTTSYTQNIVTSVVHNGNLITSGLRKGIFAIRVAHRGAEWTTETLWEVNDLSMYMSSPVLVGDLMFGFSHLKRGQFFCLDPATGTVYWVSELSEPRQGDNAAILSAGKILFFLTNEAKLIIARAVASGYEILRQYSVAESSTWAHPVIVGNGVLIKDESKLALWTWNVP
jgi:outer membrane protein assembly factor BamB